MKRIPIAIFAVLLLSPKVEAFFNVWPIEKRIAKSTLIAVVVVDKVNDREGRRSATVTHSVLGAHRGQKIQIWDDWRAGDDGTEIRWDGRDPYMDAGKRYLVYLKENQKGRLVTVQSALDCLEVVDGQVAKEGAEGFEPLADKLARIRAILAQQQKEAEQGADGDAEPSR